MRYQHYVLILFLDILRPPSSTLFPYTTLFRSVGAPAVRRPGRDPDPGLPGHVGQPTAAGPRGSFRPRPRRLRPGRSEEHTSELQSHVNLVCRLLLEKKNNIISTTSHLLHVA